MRQLSSTERLARRLLIPACCAAMLFSFVSASAADAPARATTATTAPAAARPPVVVPATIEAFEQTDLYAKLAGYVSTVNVDIGDRVKAGQVLAELDVP